MASAFPEEDMQELCDICQSDRIGYCLKCMVGLCEKCKDTHVDNGDEHDLINLPPLKPNMPMCREHDDRESSLYCWGCQVPLCEECAQEKHQKEGHDVIKMMTAAIMKRNQLVRDYAEEKHKLTPKLLSQAQNIEEGVEAYKAYFQNLKDAMRAQAEKLKEMVNEIVEERQRELKEMERNSNMILEDQRQKLEGHVAEIHDTINEYRETEQSGDPQKIKEFADKNFDKIQRLKQFPELVKVTPPTYESPQVDVEFIRKMLGTIVIKQHTWTTTEPLKFPDQEELTELPTLDKEEVRKKFGTLVVTEAEATEDETTEDPMAETEEETTSPGDGEEEMQPVIPQHIPNEDIDAETKDNDKNVSDTE